MGEVALFVDFENIRYGVNNTYHRELRVDFIMEKAMSYGPVRVAKAYADFTTEHPEKFMRQLYIAGIQAVNLSKRQVSRYERKNSADIHLIMDMVDTLLEQPSIDLYLLAAGDSDYIRIVTLTRNRFKHRVVIAGIPGTVSQDLIDAAGGEFEPLVPPPVDEKKRMEDLIRKINQLEITRPYITFKYISDAAFTDSKFEFVSTKHSADFVSQMVNEKIFESYLHAGKYKALKLNRSHPLVISTIGSNSNGNSSLES